MEGDLHVCWSNEVRWTVERNLGLLCAVILGKDRGRARDILLKDNIIYDLDVNLIDCEDLKRELEDALLLFEKFWR